MRVLIIYPGFPHYRDGVIEELMKSDKNEFFFIGDSTMMKSSIKPYLFPENAKFIDAPSFRFKSFIFHKNMISFILKNNFDAYIFHASPFWVTISMCVLIIKIKKQLLINWTHGVLSDKKSFKNKIYKYYFKLFDKLFLYGNHAKKNMIELGFKSDNLIVLNNSLNYKNQLKYRDSLNEKELLAYRKKLFPEHENKQLVFIGRLTPQKKLSFIIDAINKLRASGLFFNLLFVGTGSEESKLREITEKLNLSNQICFYGACYDESEIYKLIASSDCCVSPGEIGLTAIHSLMYGTPVITHDDFGNQMPEFESVVSGFNGMLFEKDNVFDFCEKIKFWFSQDLSRDQVRKNCYELIDTVYNPYMQREIIEKNLNKK